jgi:hypothetical protein
MTVELAVIVAGFSVQITGLVMLGVLILRQTRMLVHMADHFSPGEAAIFHDTRKLRELYEEMARTLEQAR